MYIPCPGYIYCYKTPCQCSRPQGTVLGPLLFLLHINDLLSVVSSKIKLVADDC